MNNNQNITAENVERILNEEFNILNMIVTTFQERLSIIPGCRLIAACNSHGSANVMYTPEALLYLYLDRSGNSINDDMYHTISQFGLTACGCNTTKLVDIYIMGTTIFVGPSGFNISDPDILENIYDEIIIHMHNQIVYLGKWHIDSTIVDNADLEKMHSYLKKLLAVAHNRIVGTYIARYNRKLPLFNSPEFY